DKLSKRSTYCTGTLNSRRKGNPKKVLQKKLKKGESTAKYANNIIVGKWKDEREALSTGERSLPQPVHVIRIRGAEKHSDTDKQLKKKERGSFSQVVCNDNKVCIVKCFDNNCVTVASSYMDAYLLENIQRYDKESKQKKPVTCPKIIKHYNAHMGGVDLADILVALYRIEQKEHRWKDRLVLTSQKYRGGGVLIAVKKNFSSNVIALNKDNVEQIFVNVYAYGDELVIGGIYLPPSSRLDLYEDHCATVDSVMERFPKKSCFCTVPNVEWYNDEFGVSAIYNNNNAAQILIESLAFHNLFQLNSIKNCFGVMLDLIFTNDKDIITVESANDCLLPCDSYHRATVSSITSNKDFKELNFENSH
ncbi:PiggyBac transposable element-derived protein 3, partial [Gonioctena quinquepunctata]